MKSEYEEVERALLDEGEVADGVLLHALSAVEVLVDDAGRTTWRSLVERAGATLDEFVVSADGEVAALLWNRKGLSELELAHPGRGSIVEVRLEGGTARDLTILARAIQDRFPRYYKYFQTR